MRSFYFVDRTKAVITDCSGNDMISADFKCASHGAMDVLARTVFRVTSEEMATNSLNRWMTSTGAIHAGWINGWLR